MTPEQANQKFRQVRRIHGWFSREAAQLFALLDEAQKRAHVGGNLFEIGVHHGRSTVFLGGLVDGQKERLAVCDIFDQQELNVSGSGRGNYEVFLANMRRAFGRADFVDTFQCLSSELTPEDIGTKYRFFHIDGGHSHRACYGDLELAAACTIPNGLIVVDDPFRPEWPGVTEAILRFLEKYDGIFCPFLLGFNKFVLIRASSCGFYETFLREHAWSYVPREPFALKMVQVVNSDVYVFYVPTYKSEASVKSRLFAFYFNNAALQRVVPSWAARAVSRLLR